MNKLEVCCGSYEDAMNAYHGGAKRIELNSALALGGLTPTIASLELIKNNTDLEVICMVRLQYSIERLMFVMIQMQLCVG